VPLQHQLRQRPERLLQAVWHTRQGLRPEPLQSPAVARVLRVMLLQGSRAVMITTCPAVQRSFQAVANQPFPSSYGTQLEHLEWSLV
jgi:hypothetical protein